MPCSINLIIRTELVEIIRQYIEYIAHNAPFCVSKQTGCLTFSEVVWLVCRNTACASAVHSTSGFHVANVGTVAPRAEWRLYFRSSRAPRQGKSTPAPPAMILSALCKNSVDAVSKPSFYFLLRPAFVIGAVISCLPQRASTSEVLPLPGISLPVECDSSTLSSNP